MVNQQRNILIRERLRKALLFNIGKQDMSNTIDVEYEEVTDEPRKNKKQIPSSKGEVH